MKIYIKCRECPRECSIYMNNIGKTGTIRCPLYGEILQNYNRGDAIQGGK